MIENEKPVKFKPWLGDLFSFLYDAIMESSIFPRKFFGSYQKHLKLLQSEFAGIHGKNILELATGSGNVVKFLPQDNLYVGTDISPGLLKIANRKFFRKQFNSSELYVCSAEDLPFKAEKFDLCVCNLSINFFPDINKVMMEIRRVLKKDGYLFGSVPIPEKKRKGITIRGKLYSEKELEDMFQQIDFNFTPYDFSNGVLLYFKAVKI